ncbi:MAG: hypothetical protein ABJB17_12100 [Burkholderiales bacterium]
MKTFDIRRDRRDYDPAKLRTWVGVCTLTAAAYAAIVVFSPADHWEAQQPTVTATAPTMPPISSGLDPSVPPAAQALAGVAVDLVEPAPTF